MTSRTSNTAGIVGAGIIGVQLARALQIRGLSVTLIDDQAPGHGTSFGNAGFIATDEIFPLARGRILRSLPRMLSNPLSPLSVRWGEFPQLASWFLRYAHACSSIRAQHSVNALSGIQRLAADSWREVVRREGLAGLVRETGAWKLFESDQAFRQTAAERHEQLDHGIIWEAVPIAELRAQMPELGPTIKHGLFYAAGMSVLNPLSVTEKLTANFIADGGKVLSAEVTAIVQAGTKIPQLETTDGGKQFDHLVIAAGHRSGRLLEPLGLNVPMVSERGYHIELSHNDISFDAPVGLHERGFYMTPMSSGLRLAGTSEFSSAREDRPANWARAEILKQHADAIIPGITREQTGRWMGHRPTLYDFLPVLGQLPGLNQTYAAFGHHHLGLTLSAISAELVADQITADGSRLDLSSFSLGRFQ